MQHPPSSPSAAGHAGSRVPVDGRRRSPLRKTAPALPRPRRALREEPQRP
jgi:hypothetical protein